MAFFDQALASGDFQWLEDLIKGKAHVKAHFRKDSTTGKLIYIQEHERELHPTHVVFAKGDKVKILHGSLAGKEGVVKGYSEDKHVLRLNVDGYPNVSVVPHKVEHSEKTHKNTPGEIEKTESEPWKNEPSEQEFLDAINLIYPNVWSHKNISAEAIVDKADAISSGDPAFKDFPNETYSDNDLFYGGIALAQLGEPEKAKQALEFLKKKGPGKPSEEDPLDKVMKQKIAEHQAGFKPGDKLTTTDVLHKLPSGSVIDIHSNGKFWKKARIVDNGDKMQIFLENQKLKGTWNTVPLNPSQMSSFWAGQYGENYLSELGNGIPEPLTLQIKGDNLLAHIIEGGHKIKLPFMYKEKSSAEAVAEGLTEKGLPAEAVPKGDHFCVKILDKEQVPSEEPVVELIKEPEPQPLSPSLVINTAIDAGASDLKTDSEDQIKDTIKGWKKFFDDKENFDYWMYGYSGQPSAGKAMAILALSEMGKHQEAHLVFESLKADKKNMDDYWNNVGKDDESEPAFTLDQHHAFMKKLSRGEVTADELKAAFQKFLDNKEAVKQELTSKTVKDLSKYGFLHSKKKSDMVHQIMSNMMTKYVPSGAVTWNPFGETYEQAVQRFVNQTTDAKIQEAASSLKNKKAAHIKAISNPETIEEYQKFIQHHGQEAVHPWKEEIYQGLLQEKADKEAAAKAEAEAKIKPKIETKEVGFHGHFLSDKKGLKVFGSHEEAKSEAEKLKGHYNAIPIGKLIKIGEPGEIYESPSKWAGSPPPTVKVGPDTWYATPEGKVKGFESDDDAKVVANKLQHVGHNALAVGQAIIFPSKSSSGVDFTYHETTHTKHGHPLFVAKLTEKVDKPTYNKLLSQAKKHGGYYSSFSQGGAIPGFTFKDKAKAQAFMAEAKKGS